jgi:hypothetical protein
VFLSVESTDDIEKSRWHERESEDVKEDASSIQDRPNCRMRFFLRPDKKHRYIGSQRSTIFGPGAGKTTRRHWHFDEHRVADVEEELSGQESL